MRFRGVCWGWQIGGLERCFVLIVDGEGWGAKPCIDGLQGAQPRMVAFVNDEEFQYPLGAVDLIAILWE